MMELLGIDWIELLYCPVQLNMILSAPDPLEPVANIIVPAKSGVKDLVLKIMTLIGIGMFLYGSYRVFFDDSKSGVIIIVGGLVLSGLAVALISAA